LLHASETMDSVAPKMRPAISYARYTIHPPSVLEHLSGVLSASTNPLSYDNGFTFVRL